MKNQYFGDINDFLKYGLLRILQSCGQHKLLVVWMLTPDDSSSDGGRRNYLSQPDRCAHHDPDLHGALATLLSPGVQPRVSLLEAAEFLPRTTYYSAEVPDAIRLRDDWQEGMYAAAGNADLVFLDPDNGIEVASKPMGRKASNKYVLWDEIQSLWDKGCSLLIYQHFRREPRQAFVQRLCEDLALRTRATCVKAFVTAHVAFFLVAQARHVADLERGIAVGLPRWKGQISLVDGVPAPPLEPPK